MSKFRHVSDRVWLQTDLDFAKGCPGCVHWHAFDAPEVEEDETGPEELSGTFIYEGICKRYPPVRSAGADNGWEQPTTTFFDRCGEWKGGRKPCSYDD